MALKKLIKSLVSEVFETKHFQERVMDRLYSPNSTLSQEKPELKDIVFKRLEYLSKIKFPGQHNWLISIFKGGSNYVYHKDEGNKIEHSEGRFILVTIQANEFHTIFFNREQKYDEIKQAKYQITFETLQKYIEEVKKNDFNLTDKDVSRIVNKDFPWEKKQKSTNADYITRFNGSYYIVDFKNQMLINKNNPQKSFSIYDLLDQLDEKTAEEILNRMAEMEKLG